MSVKMMKIIVIMISIIVFLDGCSFNSSKAIEVESTKNEITISSYYNVEENSNSVNTIEEENEKETDYWSMEFGDVGRLVIEDVGITVALYTMNGTDIDHDQAVVDKKDSAGWGDYTEFGESSHLIADHNYQEFKNLCDVTPGTSVARILHSDGTEDRYICTRIDNDGTNDGEYIYDSDGENVAFMDSALLYMYTCNSNWRNVTITFWYPIN